jgi:ATP-dependent 26S proteasome regulatory subunit
MAPETATHLTRQEPFASEGDLSLKHLQAELARIDVLIRRQVQRWRLAGQEPADNFRGLYVSEAEVDGLLVSPSGGNWGQMSDLAPEEAGTFAEAEAEAARNAQAWVETAQRQGQTLRLIHLATAFGLDRFDLDTFLICLMPTLDLRYERLYSYLQDDVTRKRPSVNLVLDLLGEPGPERLLRLSHFSDDAPLFKHRLLERISGSGPGAFHLLGQALAPDEAIVAWLLGDYQPHVDLRTHATLLQPQADVSQADELLAAAAWPYVERLIGEFAPHAGSGPVPPVGSGPPIVVFYGPDQMGQQAATRLCAARLGRPFLAVDLEGMTKAGLSPLHALRLALRDACLTGAIPYLFHWDACLAEEGTPPPGVLAELCAYPGLAIVAGQAAWQARGIDRERPLLWLEFPAPAYERRHALWRHFLGQRELDGAVDLASLAGQFALTSGQIRDAVASAGDIALQQGRPLQNQDLFAAARAHSNPHLADLARKIVPRYTWSDIILPEDQLAILCEIVATVRGRPLVLDEWGVGQKLVSSAGVTVLFAGPPGTGKTMAAEIIAAELGLDLYKIDLSTVVSKYIGETEKNLERIFNEAQSSNAILFFDEADAIFGKRSEVKDAHDRYANIEISYLLQRMEAYDGVTILATNLRANLDEAFTRRLGFAVDFPFPDEADRLRIWQTLFPPGVPRAPELDFGLLARRFKLAGGNIRNVIVSAAYLAAADSGQVTMKHLLHCTRRELQKMGRLVNEADLAIE